MKNSNPIRKHFTTTTLLFAAALLIVGAAFTLLNVNASGAPSLNTQASPLHPLFPLLDQEGQNVLDSGAAVSTMETCGSCHDTEFIQAHSYHSSQGIQDLADAGELPGSRAWDTSPGLFGRWSPIAYRYLTPQGDEIMDLGTPGWIMTYGPRHVGGGPAAFAPDGTPLTELENVPGDPQTNLLDPETGEMIPWNWEESGVVEMNCFLCHTDTPDNEARNEALHSGAFGWANTATLLGTGVVSRTGEDYQWNTEAFDEQGNVKKEALAVQDPDNENCAACHGLVHDNLSEPLTISGCNPASLRTVTTGQIISPQRLSDTGMNLDQKESLTRPWDIHADRLVSCTDCHYSLNNPVYAQESEESRPDHLLFDPRRLDLGEYLYQPLHQFARGQSAHNTVAPQLRDTMRRCDSCHSIETTHDWLPYKGRHIEALSCETCHIPEMYSNALMQYDWTVITTESTGVNACRGIEGDPSSAGALITGFEPVLLPKEDIDDETQLAPFNLVTTFYWVHGDPARPVRLMDLESVYLSGGQYSRDVIEAFDVDGDGQLIKSELLIDTESKVDLIKNKLEALGLEQVRIQGEIQPYSINHTVATGEWAVSECESCHSQDSRITRSFQIAKHLPGGTAPQFVGDSNTLPAGEFFRTDDGGLHFKPDTKAQDLYVLGLNAVRWVDLFGGFAFLGVLLGVSVHGGIRVYNAARSKPGEQDTERVYMYGIYERLWHWLQTITIVGLLFTGLIIHRPDVFGIFSFKYVVLVHNILAGILVVNAGLALFYHLASGEIRQFIPRPYGFFDQAITQAKYYLGGIFKGDPHPFEKTPVKKLNPLQQITYFSILNVLLPLQVITGALMWGAQQWPQIADALGGLPFLAPFHSLIAWLFAAFIVLHVYLTTTGNKPLTAIKAMMDGWDEIEKHPHSDDEEEV
ncbi:MAG: cytochrome b/b6 domain-containing protein [Anaerolineales bacterium]|jgi:thiosulfate reductase cytochrome b subunit